MHPARPSPPPLRELNEIDVGALKQRLDAGGITILDPRGGPADHVDMPDVLTTNICFGGDDLKTAYITLSSTGKLVSMPWETAGLPLNYLNK